MCDENQQLADSDALVHSSSGEVSRLLEIMRRLRDPVAGCPWDVEQDFASIAPYTIEEAYEVADAIEREAWDELRGELGDLLLQVVYHAQMADEEKRFDFNDIVRAICDKMVARHPHVFGDESNRKSAEQQTRDWEAAKEKERGEGRVLDGVAASLPAMTRALKLQKRAARVGFDWDNPDLVLEKLVEEAGELRAAQTAQEREHEFGDLAFVLVNLARHLGIDPEAALRKTNQKFIRRFNGIEDRLAAQDSTPAKASLDEMEALWTEIKRAEKAR